MKTFILCLIVMVLVFVGSASVGAQETPQSIYEILKQRNTRFHRLGYNFSGHKMPKGTLSVRLRAVDANSGVAVDDFSVTFIQGEVEEYRFNNEVVILCGEGPWCEIGALFPRPYTMRVAAPEYELVQRVVSLPVSGESVITVPLIPAAGTIKGRVYDTITRQPLAGVVVSVLDQGTGVKSSRTNEEGYFLFNGLRVNVAGKEYSLVCDSPNHFSKEIYFSFDGNSSEERDVFLDFAPSVDGKLLDSQDNPLADEDVFLLSKPMYESWQRSLTWAQGGDTFTQSTNKSGRFRFEKLRPGRYVLLYGKAENDVAELVVEGMDQLNVQLKRTLGKAL